MAGLRFNLISDLENTVGLATDLELLTAFLGERGHTTTSAHWRDTSPIADVNIFVEKFGAWHLHSATQHIGIFNLEWLHPSWVPHLHRLTQIWAKSAAAFEWYKEQGFDNAYYTGFLSRDLRAPINGKRSRAVVHVAGRSQAKNTTAVLRAYWEAAKAGIDLPVLIVVAHVKIDPLPPGVMQYIDPDRATLAHVLNEAWFHLCPSEVEGWGHYITEALSTGGIVITTDASPMHEHVLPTFGRLITPSETKRGGFADRHAIDHLAILTALREVATLPDENLRTMGESARQWWYLRNEGFKSAAGKLLKRLEG